MESALTKAKARGKTVLALKVASFSATMSWITWVPRLPELKDHLHLSFDQLGLILMVAGLTMSVSAKPTAALIQKFNSKRTIPLGVVITVIGNAAIGLSSEGLMLTVGLVIASFGVGLVNTANNTQINSLSIATGQNERNKLSAYAPLGSMASLILGTLLLDALNTMQYLMFIQLLTSAMAMAVNHYFLDADEGAAEKGTKQVKMPWFGKRMIPFWIALSALYATTLAEFSVSDWGGILARDNFHVSAPWFLLVILAFQLGLFTSRALATRLIEKHGEIMVVRVLTMGSALIWGVTIFVAGPVGQASPFWALVISIGGFFIAGCGIGPNWGVLLAAATVPGYPAPVVLSRVFGLLSLVFSFGPGLVGLLAKTFGLVNAMLLPVICLGVVGLMIPVVIRNDLAGRAGGSFSSQAKF